MTLAPRSALLVLGGALLLGAGAASVTQWAAPPPSADVARGSEEAFFRQGLHRRELPPGGKPLHWTTAECWAEFRRLPLGPATLAVEVRGHRNPVRVLAGGAIVGTIPVEATTGEWALWVRDESLAIGLATEPFVASDGRRLGTQLRRVALTPLARPWLPSGATTILFLVPAILICACALSSGCRPLPALALTAVLVALSGALLTTHGALRSAYAEQVMWTLVSGALVGAVFARFALAPAARGLGFAASQAAAWVHLVLAPSSLMVVSDAVFQAHKLEQVARGDFFPTSATQHAVPFVFPYGVSFFALLAPLTRTGLDSVTLVRFGAGVAGWLGCLGLFLLLAPRSPRWALGAVLALQVLPGTFVVYSQGNLPNVFGQAMTLLFLAWWGTSARGGWLVGALLFALAGTGHLSSAIVLAALAVSLTICGREDLADNHARRTWGLAAGLALLALYYACFWRLAMAQLPRLLEGPGQGAGQSLRDVLHIQWNGLAWEWLGLPALVLAGMGWRALRGDRLARTLRATLLALACLCIAALVSPVDTRYLYAATAPVAVLAAAGFEWMWRSRGVLLRVGAALLAVLQLRLALLGTLERLLSHYR